MTPISSVLGYAAMADYKGEFAALATAGCWTVSALAFTEAARRIGSLPLNIIRLAMALGFFVVFGWIVRGMALPVDASSHNWWWLGLSGLVGFTLGDLCLFRAFVLIGPRIALLTLSLVPMLAAVASWAALGEGLSTLAVAGMALTIGGVAWVVLERTPLESGHAHRTSTGGMLLAVGAAAGQAGGLVLSKIGMSDGYDAFAATQIRVIAGLAGFAAIFFVLRAWPRLIAAFSSRAGLGFTALGACFGPFLGVSFSLAAVKYTYVGVAATIISIVPVLVIPFILVIYKERISVRAVFGAVIAVAGVALLFV